MTKNKELKIGVGEIKITEIELIDRLLLLGPPGVGKTEVIRKKAQEEAKKMGRIFVDLTESNVREIIKEIEREPDRYYLYIRIVAPHLLPEDVSFPIRNNNYVDFALPRLLHLFTLQNIMGTIFIDELSNVQRDDQLTLYYAFILEKQIGWVKLSNNVKIIAAANDAEWSEVVRPLPRPLRNRLIILHVEPPSIEEWIQYMDQEYGEKWDKLTAAYLMLYPEDFIKPPQEDDGFTAFATPRSWTQLAALLLRVTNERLKEAIVIGTVGKEVGAKFVAMLKDVTKLPEIIERLKREPAYFKELTVTEKILVIHHLASHHNEYADIISRLEEDEYLVMLIMLIPQSRRLTFLSHHKDIARKIAHRIATIQ